MSFAGKQAIVTGAGSGIGAALCRALVEAGAHVVCTDIDGEAAERTAAALGDKARSARLDVTDASAVQATVDEVVDRAGRLDLLFNNAGICWGGDTELLTLDQWNAIIDINLRGVVHGVAAAYPLMLRQGHGHIVNTASMAGLAAPRRFPVVSGYWWSVRPPWKHRSSTRAPSADSSDATTSCRHRAVSRMTPIGWRTTSCARSERTRRSW
jgi:NAD(P)-dependent dehydrogenase (short-subunit alcohol dehydrogenase family)